MKFKNWLISNFDLIVIEKWTNSHSGHCCLMQDTKQRQQEQLEGKGYKNQSAFIKSLSYRVLTVCFRINAQNDASEIMQEVTQSCFPIPIKTNHGASLKHAPTLNAFCAWTPTGSSIIYCAVWNVVAEINKKRKKFFFLFLTCLIFAPTVTPSPQPPLLDISWKNCCEYQHLTQGSSSTEPELIKHDRCCAWPWAGLDNSMKAEHEFMLLTPS